MQKMFFRQALRHMTSAEAKVTVHMSEYYMKYTDGLKALTVVATATVGLVAINQGTTIMHDYIIKGRLQEAGEQDRSAERSE